MLPEELHVGEEGDPVYLGAHERGPLHVPAGAEVVAVDPEPHRSSGERMHAVRTQMKQAAGIGSER